MPCCRNDASELGSTLRSKTLVTPNWTRSTEPMLPRLFSFEWGGLVFHLNGYGFSIFCGTAAAMLIAIRRGKRADLPLGPLLKVFMISVFAGFAGSKLAFALQYGRFGG